MSIKQITLIVTAVLAGVVTLAVAIVLLDKPTVQEPTLPPPVVSDLTVENLLREVNEERRKAGVAPLTIDPLLNKSAQLKADEIERTGVFEHVGRDGRRGLEYIREVGVQGCITISENLADDFGGTDATVKGWLDSPTHRKVMLDGRYDTTGFGIVNDTVTEHFCDLP